MAENGGNLTDKAALRSLNTASQVVISRQAAKDAVNIVCGGFRQKVDEIIETVKRNPFEISQDFEALKGNMKNKYSRRINKKHRFVYEIDPNLDGEKDENDNLYEGIVWVISMWTHYEKV